MQIAWVLLVPPPAPGGWPGGKVGATMLATAYNSRCALLMLVRVRSTGSSSPGRLCTEVPHAWIVYLPHARTRSWWSCFGEWQPCFRSRAAC